jgi:6-phosphofructokinase 1
MGRNSGYLAVMAGIVCGAEMTLVPEVPVQVEEVATAVEDAYRRGKTHAIIINAEGSNIERLSWPGPLIIAPGFQKHA